MRKTTRQVKIGSINIGNGAPVTIQSMTNTRTSDIDATLEQIWALQQAGCELIRVAVPDQQAVKAFAAIKSKVNVPLIADVHFNPQLALKALDAGADKIRINPGNIGKRTELEAIAKKAVSFGIPIRIGVNSGSLEKELLKREGGPTVNALVESAVRNIRLMEDFGCEQLVVSIKSSDVLKTISAYEALSKKTHYPLHLGLTEAGPIKSGTIKSSVAMGVLLYQGIGDTLRVSLTGDPVEEVFVAQQILKAMGLKSKGITVISCPTCGRCAIDIVPIAQKVEDHFRYTEKTLTVAVMGCEVNGPGEAREADIGIACGKTSAVLFKKGEVLRKVRQEDILTTLIHQVDTWDGS
ncbi:flavodoxin-dependent (E)-4-hydroxy-3-methylbut-2-enyl-diphosphate synthase [candidate division KSB1 bacterium]|nr:flavodoxin-dependent (E)-4-hydroxy-3-methylbut-2-enyl-diphosphate synthase [candidate division KSB1 bacterium]